MSRLADKKRVKYNFSLRQESRHTCQIDNLSDTTTRQIGTAKKSTQCGQLSLEARIRDV